MNSDRADQRRRSCSGSGRRAFLKTGLVVGAVGVLAKGTSGAVSRRKPARVIGEDDPSNIKIGVNIDPRKTTDDDLLFLQQIGIGWGRLQFGSEAVPFESVRDIQERCAGYGIRIYSAVHTSYQSPAIQFGFPDRDRDIETYCRFIRHLGRLNIPVASYDFLPGNTFSTGTARRRGYTTREFDLDVFRAKVEKCQYGREYSTEEIWANYTYFIKAVLPVAIEAGVRLALHPDDPPVARMNCVNRIFCNYEGFRRAEQIADSPYWGLLFCVGTWSEGGERMGKSAIEMIRDFGGRGRIFEVHFRNVSSTLPRFVETFPDDGCVDMDQIMRALREVRYHGGLGPDHIPGLVGDENHRAGTAYCVSYIRALLRQSNRDIG